MSKWYCPLPFKHAYVDSTGIAACCQTPRVDTTMQQWKDHPALINLQTALLDGKQPTVCATCVHNEKVYGRSLRTDSNRDYGNKIYTSMEVDFVDFRSKNICNFKCRSCGPTFSHLIAQEISTHPELKKFHPLVPHSKTVSVTEANMHWIMDNLGSLKRLMFTGGEPTVIPGVRDIISKVKQDHPHVMVLITSNASFRDDFWFEITQALPNVHWTASIDAVGPAAEIVRHGTDWSLIKRNVEWLAQHARSLNINSVVSNLTVFGLKPLLEFGRGVQYLSRAPLGRHAGAGCRHQFFVVPRGQILPADNWPADLQTKLIAYLQSCLALDLDNEQHNMLSGLIDAVKSSKFDPQLWKRTQLYNQSLDRIRQQDHLSLYNGQA